MSSPLLHFPTALAADFHEQFNQTKTMRCLPHSEPCNGGTRTYLLSGKAIARPENLATFLLMPHS